MPNLLLERYLSGKHSEVWDDLLSLGPAIRGERYYQDAVDVAAETMKRARQNLELIIPKLDKLGYRFTQEPSPPAQASVSLWPESDSEKAIREKYLHPDFVPRNDHELTMVAKLRRIEATKRVMSHPAGLFAKVQEAVPRGKNVLGRPSHQDGGLEDPEIFRPATSDASSHLARFEKKLGGPLPISLRGWYEQIAAVNLMGYHETLNPEGGSESPDPLVIDPYQEAAEAWFGQDLEFEQDAIELPLAPDDISKAFSSGGDPYAIKLPDLAADGAFLNERHQTSFVSYLRIVFQWGGFPGWELARQRPQELDYLRENLLPI